jgi:hypothetical protein
VAPGVLQDDKGEYLSERYWVSWLSSGRDALVESNREGAAGADVVELADPDYVRQRAAEKPFSQPGFGLAERIISRPI